MSPARSVSPGPLSPPGSAARRPPLSGGGGGRQSPLPPPLGRHSPLCSAGGHGRGPRPQDGSPLLLHKGGFARTGSSPVLVRRQRKSSLVPQKTCPQQMRKSMSLNNIVREETDANNTDAVLGRVVADCQKYVAENGGDREQEEEDQEEARRREEDEEEVRRRREEDLGKNGEREEEDQRTAVPVLTFGEIEGGGRGDGRRPRVATSFETLPCRGSQARKSAIGRTLVPKMRRMFEKSRSCEPDLQRVRAARGVRTDGGGEDREVSADGTESARSSFVLLGADQRSPSNSTVTLSDNSEGDGESGRGGRKGFVNKCVTKMKSFMGKSQERD